MEEPRKTDEDLARPILWGALFVIVGLAIAGIAPIRGIRATDNLSRMQAITGGFIVLVGWGFLGYGIHRFGRSGTDRGKL